MRLRPPGAPEAPPHRDSLRALDWLNASLAALLTAFGPTLALYLTDRGWLPEDIGLVLTASALAGLLTQLPVGELIDMAQSKRMLVAAGIIAVAVALLIFALRPEFSFAVAAAIIEGAAGSVLGPGIAAISLGVVGHSALAERLGRNQRFASMGGIVAAAMLGVVGYLVPSRDRFLLTATLGFPVLWALLRIHASAIGFARACSAADDHPTHPQRVSRAVLFKDSRLIAFAVCLFLFQLANASLLPLVGENLVHAEGPRSSLVMAALIVTPQIFVAWLAPWVGRTADTWGRRPLLLAGLAVVPIRSGVFAVTANPTLLVFVQALDGLSGATLGVLTALIIADVTRGTGRFNLAQGFVGALSAVGASLSTSISGFAVERFGYLAGVSGVMSVGLMATAALWMFMPETKPRAVQPHVGARSGAGQPPRVTRGRRCRSHRRAADDCGQ
jgi:MFS family permease